MWVVQKNRLLENRLVMLSVKRIINGCMAAVLALALVVPFAHANPLNDRNVREGKRSGAGQYQQRNSREAQRQDFQRKEGGEEQRPQRLSPEERRQLRRDIKDAGREIYPPRR